MRNLQVVADKDNNTLLFVATAAEYSVIEAALRKLDVPQRQVVMEVMIAEVTLKDEIQFGVDWLFKGGAPSGRGSGGNINGLISIADESGRSAGDGQTNPAIALAQGFTYIINNTNFPGGIQAALKLLDSYGNTKIVANPHVAALDNQKATIKSGDRIPINSNTTVGGTTNAITTTSQYIDTGVLLQVTPHINVGGLVTLDVQAEVSVPGNSGCTPDQGCAPPIATRSVQTLLAVPSGHTMVMGGLINETRANRPTASRTRRASRSWAACSANRRSPTTGRNSCSSSRPAWSTTTPTSRASSTACAGGCSAWTTCSRPTATIRRGRSRRRRSSSRRRPSCCRRRRRCRCPRSRCSRPRKRWRRRPTIRRRGRCRARPSR